MADVNHCPICSSNKFLPKFIKNSYTIVVCSNCTHLFVSNPPSKDAIHNIYAPAYFDRGGKYEAATATDPNTLNDLKKIELLRKYIHSGKVLDLGCALGGFLTLANQYNYECVGVEISSHCIEKILERDTMAQVYEGDIFSAKFADDEFSAVVMWDVIEHLPNVLDVVDEVHRILKPGGYLIFSTGDSGSFYARISGRFWHLLTPPQHLSFFTSASIDKLLHNSRLSLIERVYFGKVARLDFILFKAQETFGRIVSPLRWLADKLGISKKKLNVNLGDIVTVVAQKGL